MPWRLARQVTHPRDEGRSPGRLPSGELSALLQHRERARRARHQEAVALGDQALDVLGVGVGVAAGDVVVLADLEDAVDGLGHDWVLVLAGVAELLAEVALAD